MDRDCQLRILATRGRQKAKVMKPMKAKVIKRSTAEKAKVMNAKAKAAEKLADRRKAKAKAKAAETAEIEEIAEQIATAATLHSRNYDECLKQIIRILA